MNKLIAVTGPTASGKSALALELCERLGGELISCDSMQVYRKMNIGTAKPTGEEMLRVRHHMIDVADPCDDFSCADYVRLAIKAVEGVYERGHIPVLCGGTGLYFERLVMTAPPESPPCSPEVREALEKQSNEQNYNLLKSADPEAALAIHMNNRKRIIRALEIYLTSGVTKTEWDRRSLTEKPRYDVRQVSLICADRSILYSRIDNRVDRMLEAGLLNEVRGLYGKMSETAGQAIGYKEITDAINGACTLNEAVDRIKQGSRNYAKRQLTWFKRYKNALFCDIGEQINCESIVKFLS